MSPRLIELERRLDNFLQVPHSVIVPWRIITENRTTDIECTISRIHERWPLSWGLHLRFGIAFIVRRHLEFEYWISKDRWCFVEFNAGTSIVRIYDRRRNHRLFFNFLPAMLAAIFICSSGVRNVPST